MIGRFFYAMLYWPYERGSWQWDIACLVILVVIFATPGDFLEGFTRTPLHSGEIHERLRGFFEAFWG